MNIQLILDFLANLEKNNHRDWMDENKNQYLEARKVFDKVITQLINEIASFDPAIRGLSPKDCIFRLNRDIRFSKNKSPYKTNFGAFMTEGGRKGSNAGYYLHLQPGDRSFLAGGMYMPDSDALKKVRQEIDYNASELKKIVTESAFKNYFGQVTGDRLKTAPKGYSPDHPNIEFLKLKSYIVMHQVHDSEVIQPDFINNTADIFKALHPLNEFLNVAVS